MGQMVAAINDVGRILDCLVHGVVLDLRQRLVRQTNFGRRLVPEFQAQDFSARRDQPTFHSSIWWESAIGRTESALRTGRGAKSERKCARGLGSVRTSWR